MNFVLNLTFLHKLISSSIYSGDLRIFMRNFSRFLVCIEKRLEEINCIRFIRKPLKKKNYTNTGTSVDTHSDVVHRYKRSKQTQQSDSTNRWASSANTNISV